MSEAQIEVNEAQIEETDPIRIMLVGDSGTHKTYFLATIPEVFVFDFDFGMTITRGMGVDVEYESFKDAPRGGRTNPEKGIYPFGTAWPKFIARLNHIGSLIDKGKWNRPIAIDSLTTMANCAMAYVKLSNNHLGNPQLQHWGAQMDLIESVLEQLNSWGIPLVVTAHIQRNTNDLTQVIEYLPLVTGKLAGKLGLYFDDVYYASVKGSGTEKKFVLQTESDNMYRQAKTRWGVPSGCETSYPAVLHAIHQGGAYRNKRSK
jgi:hypothetical protein